MDLPVAQISLQDEKDRAVDMGSKDLSEHLISLSGSIAFSTLPDRENGSDSPWS
jgi:hypothetical protein